MVENIGSFERGGLKKIHSACDLHASDNLRSIIIQVQLRGENYDEWAQAVRISLRARRKWGLVDGTHEKPGENEPEFEDW